MALSKELRSRLRVGPNRPVLFVNVGKTWPTNGGTIEEQELAGLGDWVLHRDRAATVAVLVAWRHDDVVAAWKVDDPAEVRKSAQGTRYRYRSATRLSKSEEAELRCLLPEDYRMYSAVKYVEIE